MNVLLELLSAVVSVVILVLCALGVGVLLLVLSMLDPLTRRSVLASVRHIWDDTQYAVRVWWKKRKRK